MGRDRDGERHRLAHGASAIEPFISREMPPVGRWKSRSTTRAGLPGSPSSRSSSGAIFGPTPGKVVAGSEERIEEGGTQGHGGRGERSGTGRLKIEPGGRYIAAWVPPAKGRRPGLFP